MSNLPKIIIILGPTATGKTKLAVRLAQKFDGEIVSADSRQVYKYMNIGSGKDLGEFKVKSLKLKGKWLNIKHHLIDTVSPNANFNVAKYQKLAYRAIDDILARGKLPIVVGGTGLYISAIVDGLPFNESKTESKKLKIIRKKLEKSTLKQLLKKLEKIDQKTYNIIDKNNRYYVQRAVEIYYQTGKTKSEQPENKPKYDCLQIGLTFPREIINQRIEQRLEQRLKNGIMTREVNGLHNKYGVSWKKLISFGLEYKWLTLYLQKKVLYDEMKMRLAIDIKHFAKRQMTWFQRDKTIHWESNFRKISQLINKHIK
jgi:tRNA dimethylallyltransferase